MLPFLTALVPMPDGLPRWPALPAAAALARASPAVENSSQKSCLSAAGPLGGAPKASQKSFFSGSARRVLAGPSPSTKRLKAVPALAADDCSVWPRVPAVLRACEAMSASASCWSQSCVWGEIAGEGLQRTFCMPGLTHPS
jgi:hypothetical protein